MFEDYDNEDFQESGNLPNRVEEALQAWQQMMMRRLVEENYDRISTQGFSDIELRTWDDLQIETLVETFNYMIKEFEEDEQYEKCAVLAKARESALTRTPFKPQDI